MSYLLAFISIVLGSLAQFMFKIGMNHIYIENKLSWQIIIQAMQSKYLWAGIISYGFSLLLWFYVLTQFELSKAYPLVSLGYVFTLILGYYFLNDSVTFIRVLGVLFILVGVILISKS